MRISCPKCKSRKLRRYGRLIHYCSVCGSIYRKSSSNTLERMNVEPVSDCSVYPEVILYATFPHCDCGVQAYIRTGEPNGGILGSRYCPNHNVIIIEEHWEPKDLETIAEETAEIIDHETLHWILCRDFSENTSLSLDSDEVFDFLETTSK